jgi:protein O-mannosyl-transferase
MRPAGWFAAALVLAGFLTYWNSLQNPAVFDDHGTITNNSSIESLSTLGQVFSPPQETPVAGRPLVNLSFAVNYALGGREVAGYHVGNIAVHVLVTLVLFGLLRRTLDLPKVHDRLGEAPTGLAFAVALVWAVHPLNSEVMDYLSQRTESLMALFYLLTLYASVRAARQGGKAAWQLVAIGASVLGMMSKESMVTVPVVVALYDRIFLFDSWRAALRARGRFWAGLAASWVVLGVLIASNPRTFSAGFTAHDADPWTYLLNQTVMIVRYLRLSVWPRNLVLFYGWPRPYGLTDVWPDALVVTALFLWTVTALLRRPMAGFLGAWFFLTLAPTSSIVPIATEVGAERRMYLPLMAVVTIVILGARSEWRHLSERRGGGNRGWPSPRVAARLGAALVAVVAVTFSLWTQERNREYASTLKLAETTFERWPTPAAHSMLGTELAAVHRFPEAEAHLRAAAAEFPPARYYLGTVLATEGKPDEAIPELEAFIGSQPAVLDQTRLARLFLADLFMRRQRWSDAVTQYRAVVSTWPGDDETHALLAGALMRLDAYDEAAQQYQIYLSTRPDDVRALGGLGVALASNGHPVEAIAAFRRAAGLDPSSPRTHQNLASALLGHGDLEEAAAEAEHAVSLAPGDPTTHELYGRVLLAQGRRDAARDEFVRALEIDPASPAREGLRRLGIR